MTIPSTPITWWQKDPAVVRLEDTGEIQYWMNRFGATQQQLHEAVKVAGPSVPAVKAYLVSLG
jgi:hypothetical protein